MIITIVNGPNLNMLGNREKNIYGSRSFDEFLDELRKEYENIEFRYFQSNIEGELIEAVQDAARTSDGIILNAAGYTHTSVSLADAVAAVDKPVVEVHISNILKREEFRHKSLIAPNCEGSIFGFGLDGYRLATEALVKINSDK